MRILQVYATVNVVVVITVMDPQNLFRPYSSKFGGSFLSKACGHKDCKASMGICESITFGRGDLDEYGYWEIPCGPCARRFEQLHPEYGVCWPFPLEDSKKESTNDRRSASVH